MAFQPDISIVIPTYNERDNIESLVRKISDSLDGSRYEIVFVDDNSGDGTAELISGLQPEYPVRVISRKNERGLASAVVRGMKEVNSEYVIVMDADLQHPPEVLPKMVRALETHDMVVASRYCPGGSPGEWTLMRRIVSHAANLLALPLAPKVKDRMSGFFAFRRLAADPSLMNAPGWKIGLEILLKGRFTSATEVPYTFENRYKGSSKLSRRIIWQYLQQLVRLYMFKFRVLNFMMVGGIGYIVNLLIYWPLTLVFQTQVSFLGQQFYLPPFVISSVVAIVCNYSLNKKWTFKGWVEQKLGALRYFSMAGATLLLDMIFLFVLVEYAGLHAVPAAAIAILVVFIIRYMIARSWVWLEKIPKPDA